VRLAGTLYALYDKTPYIERISTLLGDLELRQNRGGTGPAFHPRQAAE
jgi:hypothetical protein